jgi:hypothetical protein
MQPCSDPFLVSCLNGYIEDAVQALVGKIGRFCLVFVAVFGFLSLAAAQTKELTLTKRLNVRKAHGAENAIRLNKFLSKDPVLQENRKRIETVRLQLREQPALIHQEVSDQIQMSRPAPAQIVVNR